MECYAQFKKFKFFEPIHLSFWKISRKWKSENRTFGEYFFARQCELN